MKGIALLTLFIFISTFIFADHGLEGVWVHESGDGTINIITKPNYLLVKNLNGNDWERFYPNGRSSFKDRSGNRIKILNGGKIAYKNRCRYDVVVFRKLINQQPAYRSISGLWNVQGSNKNFIIEETELGVRCKFLGEEYDWVYYRKEGDQYIDRSDNRIQRYDNQRFIWISSRGNQEYILHR